MKLKPCPFCGCREVSATMPGEEPHKAAYVLCLKCDAEGPTGLDEADAVEKWNGRESTDLLKELHNGLSFNALTAPEWLVRNALAETRTAVERALNLLEGNP